MLLPNQNLAQDSLPSYNSKFHNDSLPNEEKEKKKVNIKDL